MPRSLQFPASGRRRTRVAHSRAASLRAEDEIVDTFERGNRADLVTPVAAKNEPRISDEPLRAWLESEGTLRPSAKKYSA